MVLGAMACLLALAGGCFLDSQPSVGLELVPERDWKTSHKNHTTGRSEEDAHARLHVTWYPDSMHQPREKPKPSKMWDDPTTPWSEPHLRLGVDDPSTEWDEAAVTIDDPDQEWLPKPPKADDYDAWLKYGGALLLLSAAAYVGVKVKQHKSPDK